MITGKQNPIVGKDEMYTVHDSFFSFDNFNAKYVWAIWKKISGKWVNITKDPPKIGQKVSFNFGEKVMGTEFKLEVYKSTKKVLTNEWEAKKLGEIIVIPTSSKTPSITKVILFNRGRKDPNKASYNDKLIAQAHCVAMFGQQVDFQLWEDDAAGEGHDANINKNNTTGQKFLARVNKNGIAEAEIPLSSNSKILRDIANRYLMKGDSSEGANHEYYVTAHYQGKIKGESKVNVNVTNPDYKPKPKEDTPKFPATPSSRTTRQTDSAGKINNAFFVNNKNQILQKVSVGDHVKVQIQSSGMIGKHIQYVVWEYDTISTHDEVYRSEKIKIEGNIVNTNGFTISQKTFDKGTSGIWGDSDNSKQNYFIEIIPLDASAESKKFGVDSSFGLMEVEKVKSPAIVKAQPKENNDICICKETKLYWGKHFTCQERKKIIDISNRLGCKPDYLTSAMALETGGTFNPAIVNSLGYTGLIQIGSLAAEDINRRKGTNITAGNNGNLKNMSKLDQLTYVEYYLEPFKGRLNTLADFYLAILMPVDCGKGNQRNHVVFDKNIALDYKDGKVVKNTKWVRQRAYVQNPAFHKEGRNEDGKTYVWEIAEEIEKWYNKGEANAESTFSCQKKAVETKKEEPSGKWHNPVDNPRLTKYNYSGTIKPSSGTYGWCRRNSNGTKKYHSGLDFFAIPGKDKVYSCLKGNIHQVRYSSNAGWIVRVKIQNVKDLLEQEKKVNYRTQYADELRGINIKETDEVYFIYMHLDSTIVTEQDAKNKKEVEAGTILGYAGVSGSIASGGKAPHLHLEIATVLDAYGHGESVRTNPARFVKLNSYDTKDQDEEAKKRHYP